MSDKRRKDIPRRRAVKAAVVRRDGGCLLRGVDGAGECWGPLECHEARKASQCSGGYTVENGRTLCRSHNQRLESDADLAALAKSMGLVKRRGDV